MSDLTFEEKVLEELKSLRERIEKLEKNDIWRQPFQPTIPQQPIKWDIPNNCSKCGIKLGQVMSYYCNNHPCPSGLGGVFC